VVAFLNPALKAFVAQVGNGLVLAQVLIRRVGAGFELRHMNDRDHAGETLRSVTLSDLRSVAQFTATGAFRPLKLPPNLRAGWRILLPDKAKLELALNQLYPGAMAGWFAAQSTPSPVTNYAILPGARPACIALPR
jgi:cobalt chelatase family protein